MADGTNINRIVSGERVEPRKDMSDDDLVSGLLDDARERMHKSVESTRHEFGSSAPGAPARRCSTASTLTITAP